MIPLETNDSELLKTANAKATPFDPSRVRMMKASGHTVAEICAAFNISVGMVSLCCSTRLDKALRQSEWKGQLELKKSIIDPREPAVILKARMMLSQGDSPRDVMKALGLSARDWSNWLQPLWGAL